MKPKIFKRIIPVGVGVLIVDDNENLLLGKRIIDDGRDMWSTPGGFLEPGESIIECAKRETLEETGLRLETITYLGVNYIIGEKDTYFDAACYSKIKTQETYSVGVLDEEVEKWIWVNFNDLGNYKLWEPTQGIIELYQSGTHFTEKLYGQNN
ncbi:NUDIX domain-containing protein [Candidatus Nomurabacteria bacterium]|nr:NUDIX domain-containing protein [Candidatus Nomurabacteria bacterium]